MSKGSQVVCDKQMVLDVSTRGLETIKVRRSTEKESIIASAMNERTWFGFGRNYTRDEAISNLNGDSWNMYHWVDNYYEDAERLFRKLIGAINVCTNGKNILLSVSDANTISQWSNINDNSH